MKIRHRYYEKTPRQQRMALLSVVLLIVSPIVVISVISAIIGWYWIIPVIVWLGITFLAPFVDTPGLVKQGKLVYYSPLLLGQPGKHSIRVHGGTLFDYCFVLTRNDNPAMRSRKVLLAYVQGLKQLIALHADEPSMTVIGTSYIINTRTANKVGFKEVPKEGIQVVLLAMNYLVLTASFSMVKGKLTFPKLSQVRTYKATIDDLRHHLHFINHIERKLNQFSSDSSPLRNDET